MLLQQKIILSKVQEKNAIAISHLQKRDRFNKLDFVGLLLSIQPTNQRLYLSTANSYYIVC
jgi:hypothetical protein